MFSRVFYEAARDLDSQPPLPKRPRRSLSSPGVLLYVGPILPAIEAIAELGERCERCWPTGALTKTTRSRATWGALRHVVSVRSLRGFRAAGLATPGPRSLRLGSASRGNLGRRPTAVKTPPETKPHSPQISRHGGPPRSAILQPMPTTERLLLRSWRPADRAPFAKLNADPEVVRFISDGVPFTRADSDELLDAIEAHWREHGFGLWCAAAREDPDDCLGFVGLAVPSFLPAVLPAVEVGLAPGAPGVGARAGHRGRARVAAPCLRRARPRGGDLDHRPANERSIRVAQKLGMRRGADHVHPRTRTPIDRLRDFFARCGVFTGALLTARGGARVRWSRRGTEPQRARPWGCEARRSEAQALLRELTWWRAPRAARDRVAFVKAL